MKDRLLTTLFKKFSLHFILLFALFTAATVGFIGLADEVREGDTSQVDQAILTAINEQSTPFFDTFFVVATEFGGFYAVVALTLGLSSLLWLRHQRRKAVFLSIGVAGAAIVNIVLKAIFERTRPDLWEQLIVEHNFSFPSGHAMASAALAAAVIIIFWNTRYRWLATVTASMYVVIIGFSRLYLGVHFPTDVVAGWSVSMAWVLLAAFAAYYFRRASKTNK